MLRRFADKILINDPSAAANIINDGSGDADPNVDITGYGEIFNSFIIQCDKTCTTASTPEEVTVDITIPDSCECPYEWCLTIVCLPNLQLYEVQNTFPSSKVYCYEDPAGGTPTAAETVDAIAASINADPFRCVDAVSDGVSLLTLTSLAGATTGFEAFAATGGVTVTQPFIPAVLSYDQMSRIFPIQTAAFGSQPTLPIDGATYCAWHVTVRNQEQVQDVDGANHWNQYEKEVTFYLRDNGAGFTAVETIFDIVLCS